MKIKGTNLIYRGKNLLPIRITFMVLLFQLSSDVYAATGKRSFRTQPKPPFYSSGVSGGGTKGINNSTSVLRLGEGIPNYILGEIRSLDNHLKCFPKLLCTIYQDNSILEKMGSLNATEIGVAYIKLLKAVHYSLRTTSTTTTEPPPTPAKGKRPIIQIFQIPAGLITASTYPGRKDHHSHHLDDLEDYPSKLRSPLDEVDDDIHNDYAYELENNPRRDVLDDNDISDEEREFLREKLEVSKMLEDSREEDNAEANKETRVATTLLSSFLPFLGSRSIKKRSVVDLKKMEELLRNNEQGNQELGERMRQEPFWKAVDLWRKLKMRNECQGLYQTCPFEAWEIVRMLDLVKEQSKVLSTYLKITVDNAKPSRLRS